MSKGRLILGVIIVTLGLSMLFDFPFFKYLWAFIIIYFGLRLMTGSRRNWSEWTEADVTPTAEDYLSRVLIFSAIRRKFVSDQFTGGELSLIFSGGEVDLSQVKVKDKEIKLTFVAILSGVKIIVPKNWQIKSEAVGILGAFDNHTKPTGKAFVHVKLEGVAILGGVEITN